MAKQDEIWVGLAEELLARPDVRSDVRARLETALGGSSDAAIGDAVRSVLAAEVTTQRRVEAAPARAPEATPSPQEIAAAKQAHALLDHGLRRAESAGGEISPRLFHFLREALTTYAEAHARAGSPSQLEDPAAAGARVLEAAARQTVPGETARVGVLTPAEVTALAAGRARAAELATVPASGSWERDVERWRESSAVDEARRAAVAKGDLRDGEYVLAVIQPGPEGQRVDVYPIAASGQASPQPVARYQAPPAVENVSVAAALVRPAVTEARSRAAAPAPRVLARQPATAARGVAGELLEARQAAIAIGHARVAIYADILRARSDLHGAARRAAERRLERMQEESEALVGATSLDQVRGLAARWQREIGADISRFAERQADPIGGESARLEALSRMGALSVRLDELTRAGEDGEPGARALRGAGGESRELVRSLESADSIFDTLPGPSVSAAAQRAEARPVPGEGLATGVILEGARRASSPVAAKQQGLRELASAGRRLRQALTSADTMRRSGLALSSSLMPLLRAEMPNDIRPDMRSPLLRSVLLPAMQRVSGPNRAAARRDDAGGAGQPGQVPARPEALFAMLLGEEGLSLIENMPSLARSIMGQMGGLAERLSSAGQMPSLQALEQAGASLRERLSGLSMIPEGVPDLDDVGDKVRDSAIGEAMGMGLEQAAGDLVAESGIDDVAGALAEEGQALTGALKDKIQEYVDIPSDTRLFAGPVATAALGEMGALGASIGRDIYVRDDVLARGGADAAAVVGHEAVHADRSRRGAGSVETEEREAYRVEGMIRDSFDTSELVKEQPVRQNAPSAGGGGDADGEAEADDGIKRSAMIDELVSAVSDLMSWEVFASKQRGGISG